MAVQIRQRQGRHFWANVYADYPDAFLVQVQEGGAPSTRDVTIGAFSHPPFCDQLFSDYRDGAALQTGMARQIGAGNRLMTANQVKHDATIDVASRLTGSDPKIGQIDLSHFFENLEPTLVAISLLVGAWKDELDLVRDAN